MNLELRNADRHKKQRAARQIKRILEQLEKDQSRGAVLRPADEPRVVSLTLPSPQNGMRFSVHNNTDGPLEIRSVPEPPADIYIPPLGYTWGEPKTYANGRKVFEAVPHVFHFEPTPRPSLWRRFKDWLAELFQIEIA